MSQNKSVEEVVKELRTWACNYHGEFFKRYSSDSEEKKKLWFTAGEVEKIIEHTIQQERQTSQEREREIVEEHFEVFLILFNRVLRTKTEPKVIQAIMEDIREEYNITLK